MQKYLMRAVACSAVALLLGCSPKAEEAQKPSKPKEISATANALGVDADSFIEGNLYFLGYHELGHALVSEFDLPVVGREEDAVDRLAIWLMTPAEDDGDPDYLMGAMHGWFLTAAERPLVKIPWWDAHGTDQQRVYQIACLVYGSDAERFGKVADTAGLPDDTVDSCVDEASQNDKAWSKLLDPHYRPDGEVADPSTITIRFDETKDYAEDAEYLKKSGLLENISELMRSNYKLQPGITLLGTECGEVNSYWNSEDRTISICYELVASYRDMAWGAAEKASAPRRHSPYSKTAHYQPLPDVARETACRAPAPNHCG